MIDISKNYIQSIQKQFDYYKSLGDKTIASISEKELFWNYNSESNSIAVIINHIIGNMLSRWTHFFTEDGEKEWRKRDNEFKTPAKNKQALITYWEEGWECLFYIISNLTEEDLAKTVSIRNEKHTVIEAINRQLTHYAYHIGQMVYVAKMIKNSQWKSLSIPKNKSEDFNKLKFGK
ncbi:DUF1572 family protein [Lutibacter sp.]